ncbi:F0F1 ATP synthase subunit A [Dethiosulfatarculus sandiegensis]|uniref:ATP synthase subunit a n=1 Tax=Dethiosulfatarculus sandiegensis TaxID=1429043 RepID=A0A0D2GM90_9BACT|nr:F0F1 ATP synthase subunit A [Dethiosulfatarculus sandiegensis]KIX15817.1 ATP synthase F0 subunit A [Dethiosulfatarculus sandiegensis]
MQDLTNIPKWVLEIGGVTLELNSETLIMSWIVMAVIILFGILATRKISILPGPYQTLAEVMVAAFEGLVNDALDESNRHYFPMIITIFLFVWLSNMLGVIPFLSEPTKDLNTPLAYGLLGFVISHYAGIKAKGIKAYLSEYVQPMFFMAPLNIVGELSKVVSISFRLYGNIMGGSIIIMVVGNLVYDLLLPPFLNAFFGIFVGTIQAFVFTMLTLVYISVQTK